MAIVKALAQAHGGTITAHSGGAGRGTRFEIDLPPAWGDLQQAFIADIDLDTYRQFREQLDGHAPVTKGLR